MKKQNDVEFNALINSKLNTLSSEKKATLLIKLRERQQIRRLNKLSLFKAYPFQKEFYAQGSESRFRFLSAANRIGKSKSAAMEMAYHLTGLYPDWWEGRKFKTPVSAWAIGITANSTRDVLQYELLGLKNAKLLENNDYDDYDMGVFGSGSIPLPCLVKSTISRDGDRVLSIQVKHFDNGKFNGNSVLEFKSTQQGHHVLAGVSQSLIWLDEEDPYNSWDIFEQCLMRTTTPKGSIILTATPENGKTRIIQHFMDATDKNLYFQMASVYDAHENIGGHISDEDIATITAGVAPHKLRMRLYGEPTLGSGAVYDIDFKDVIIPAIEIPNHWKVICAMDIGYSHNTTAVFSAYDAANDIIYITSEYGGSNLTAAQHASAIRKRDKNISVVLPKDAWQHEKGSGIASYDIYKEEGLNVLSEPFYNKYTVEGKKDFSVEFGIDEIRDRMKSGKLFIFNNCVELLKELQDYHRKDGKIVKVKDDYADAMRYSAMSVMHRGRTVSGDHFSQAFDDNRKAWQNV